jgi:hypothetical protein
MKEDINVQIGILAEAASECDRLNKYIQKKIDELDECNTYSYLSIEERIAMFADLNITKIASGYPTHEEELDLICCLLLLRAARRIKMSKRHAMYEETAASSGAASILEEEDKLIMEKLNEIASFAKCKNCKKHIADDISGFCKDANDKCWKEWIIKNKKQK